MNKYLLIAAVLIGFILRIAYLSHPNLYLDEAGYAIYARDFVEINKSPWLSMATAPPMFTWINSIPMRFLGTSEFSIRLASAVFGTFTIIIVFLLARLWYGKNTATLAALLIAILPLHVIYSRLAFNDAIQTFFVLGSILAIEFAIKRNLKILNGTALASLSGILFGISYLIKYNALLILGLYWIFIFGFSLVKQNKSALKRYSFYAVIFGLSSAIFVVLAMLLTGGIPDILYLINSTLYWVSYQSTRSVNPFNYYFLILFDSLSPLAYISSAIGLICIIFYRKKEKADYLLVFLVLSYLLVISLQPRRFSRYLIFILPFIAVILSRFLAIIFENLKGKEKKYLGIILFLLLFLSVMAWSVYKVNERIGYNAWSEAGKYIKKNYPGNITVHSSSNKYRLVQFYIGRNNDFSDSIKTLKAGDLVLFNAIDSSPLLPNLENSPFEMKSLFFQNFHPENTQEFIDYVLKHGKIAKTFEYKGKTALWIYEILTTAPYKDGEQKNENIRVPALSKIWSFVCNRWYEGSWVGILMEKYLSKEQAEAAKIKCQTKSYSY